MSAPAAQSPGTVLDRFGIGHTPSVRLPGVARHGQVWLKAEYANPFGSVKDRTAAYLLAWAFRAGGEDVHVVESTSGNLGVALAQLAEELGVPVTLVMDASLPAARVREVRSTGAEVNVVTSPRPGLTFRESRIARARELGDRPGWLWLNQYANEAGMRAHEETTGPELWDDLHGGVDAVVASVGTGGTICGIAAALRDRHPRPVVVGVEPAGSTISGGPDGDYLPAGAGMRGPSELIDGRRELVDYFAKVPDCLASAWSLELRNRFGIDAGQTTGAALAVAALLADLYGIRVAVIAPDHGRSFLPVMRQLAADRPVCGDDELIEMRPFGATRPLLDRVLS